MQTIRILVISNMYPRFMGGNFIHSQIKNLLAGGCQIKVVVPVPFYPISLKRKHRRSIYSRIPDSTIIDSIKVYHPRYLRLPGAWFHSLSCYSQYIGAKKTVQAIMNEFRPHLIHAHAVTPPGYTALLIKEKYNLPLICSLRGSDIYTYPHYDPVSMSLTRKLISEADQLLSVSNALKIATENIAKPKREIKVIYNGCDSDKIVFDEEARRNIRSQLGISEHDSVLIFVGRIEKEKGAAELLEAFKQLQTQHTRLKLVLVGDCPRGNPLDLISVSGSLSQKIRVVGKRPYNEIYKYLSAADIFILPSHSEGLPNVVLEAMACGLPVIATRVGGIPEAVDEGESGILIEKNDVQALSEAIEYLLHRKNMAKIMGNKGREIIKKKFTWKNNAENIITVYRDVINAKS